MKKSIIQSAAFWKSQNWELEDQRQPRQDCSLFIACLYFCRSLFVCLSPSNHQLSLLLSAHAGAGPSEEESGEGILNQSTGESQTGVRGRAQSSHWGTPAQDWDSMKARPCKPPQDAEQSRLAIPCPLSWQRDGQLLPKEQKGKGPDLEERAGFPLEGPPGRGNVPGS